MYYKKILYFMFLRIKNQKQFLVVKCVFLPFCFGEQKLFLKTVVKQTLNFFWRFYLDKIKETHQKDRNITKLKSEYSRNKEFTCFNI